MGGTQNFHIRLTNTGG